MPIKNYTTKLNVNEIVGRIMGLLGARGARQINIRYDSQGVPDGIQFILMIDSVPIPFRLPCNVIGVEKAIRKQDKHFRAPRTQQHFQSVAWAIVRDWVEAQLALVEAEQASLAQVFLPYCVISPDNNMDEAITMYDRFLEQVARQKRLGASVTDVVGVN